jgi:hypothetical protein
MKIFKIELKSDVKHKIKIKNYSLGFYNHWFLQKRDLNQEELEEKYREFEDDCKNLFEKKDGKLFYKDLDKSHKGKEYPYHNLTLCKQKQLSISPVQVSRTYVVKKKYAFCSSGGYYHTKYSFKEEITWEVSTIFFNFFKKRFLTDRIYFKLYSHEYDNIRMEAVGDDYARRTMKREDYEDLYGDCYKYSGSLHTTEGGIVISKLVDIEPPKPEIKSNIDPFDYFEKAILLKESY